MNNASKQVTAHRFMALNFGMIDVERGGPTEFLQLVEGLTKDAGVVVGTMFWSGKEPSMTNSDFQYADPLFERFIPFTYAEGETGPPWRRLDEGRIRQVRFPPRWLG